MSHKTLQMPAPPRAAHFCQIPLDQSESGAPVTVALAGCGGNGAQMLSKLARLDHALRHTTRRGGLHVTVFDPDHVSRANVGRQLFSPSDVGLSKAVVLVSRINAFFGLDWAAVPDAYDGMIDAPGWGQGARTVPDIVISCVDSAWARRQIHKFHVELRPGRPAFPPRYWLDLGNKRASGQVVLGQPMGIAGWDRASQSQPQIGFMTADNFKCGKTPMLVPRAARLPVVTEVFPELLDPAFDEGDEPSCSLAQALERQSLFVNDAIANCAAHLLDDLLRLGKTEFCGAFLNLETGRSNPMPVPLEAPVEAEEVRAA